ncbi:hypothetical protein [Frankia sp. KB5]|uniref:hypothetical protein n=1 Tax=Frankia sp. KB5 TaxID=683318 RepID=UPI000A101DF0|nr:hypothetical protein [Frankia sp. KB5]ORT46785.1 hypothetical protein KBI5_23340 [Frankia sp. KB5]
MSTGDLIFFLVLLGLAAAMGWWLYSMDDDMDDDEEEQSDAEPSPEEERVRSRMDALHTSQRIGRLCWRTGRALYDAARDDGDDQDGR